MHGKGSGAVNRVELECQVLCTALRQSWVRQDKVGAFTSIRELSHLFPDLLPPPEDKHGSNKANYYETLTVRPLAGLNSIVVGYLKTVRKFLREYNPKDYRQFYNTVLNAGFVLRKPRLRLSHDLVVARRWLFESQMEDDTVADETVSPTVIETFAEPTADLPPAAAAAVPEKPEPAESVAEPVPETADDESEDPLALIEKSWELAKKTGGETVSQPIGQTSEVTQNLPAENPVQPPPAVVQSSASTPESPAAAPQASQAQVHKTAEPAAFNLDESQLRKPDSAVELPALIKLMEHAHLITKVEVQAVKAQMELAPNVPVEQLVLNAGYATRTELNSLRLAQDLLSSGKITMAQFQVAMYDERTSGLRMAESLQVRGWLETEVKNPMEEFKKPES